MLNSRTNKLIGEAAHHIQRLAMLGRPPEYIASARQQFVIHVDRLAYHHAKHHHWHEAYEGLKALVEELKLNKLADKPA